jgi:shikimate kinase
MIVYLIGFMGSGKTWMGRRVASLAAVPWLDLDQIIEEKEGRTISDIFKTDGESYFRARERFWLEKVTADLEAASPASTVQKTQPTAIVSTGGGAPCFEDNMDWMNRHGITIWLNPPIETLIDRLERENQHRPVLEGRRGEALRELVTARLQQRDPYYRQAAIVIGSPHPDPSEIIEMIRHA